MHALTLLKTDHQKVQALFKEFEKTESKSRKSSIAKKIIVELSVHAAVEEQVFYPLVREALKEDDEDMILEALEEHHVAKWVLSEIERLGPEDERFDAKVTVLAESVKHHIEEEEEELFKKVRKLFSTKQLNELGAVMLKAKRVVPKRPHPRAPDSPPGNLVAGPTAKLLDRAREALAGIAAGVTGRGKASAKRGGASAKRGGASAKRAAAGRKGSAARKSNRGRASQ